MGLRAGGGGGPGRGRAALRMATALGYTEHDRTMVLDLSARAPGSRHPLPAGSAVRPLREDELGPWLDARRAGFVASLTSRGATEEQAAAHQAASMRELLPDGAATAGAALLVLEHDGVRVGTVWVGTAQPAWVFAVEVDEGRRGQGHGRALMLAAENAAVAAGARELVLDVFAGNAPAIRLYESLGYTVSEYTFAKTLL